MPVDILSYLYAATVAAGGITGYVKAGKVWIYWLFYFLLSFSKNEKKKNKTIFICAGSIPSLSAGLAFGAILGN